MEAKSGVQAIQEERLRQFFEEGWTDAHDDTHRDGELARAAACYALGYTIEQRMGAGRVRNLWPFDRRIGSHRTSWRT